MDTVSPHDYNSNDKHSPGKKPHPNKGRKLSEEHKQKLSAAKKGKPSNRKGIRHTPETKRKLSEANKRRPPMSQETRDKMSKSRTGRTGPWKDKPIPPEVRQKMYATRKERGTSKHTPETKRKLSIAHTGKTLSPEHRLKISENLRGNQRLKNYWATLTPEERLEKLQKWIKAPKDYVSTTIEQAVQNELDRRDIAYSKQVRVGRYFVDFMVSSLSLVIECDGCYWHACEQCGFTDEKGKREYDRVRSAHIESKGYTVAHLWEHDLRKSVVDAVEYAIALCSKG